MNKVAFVNGFLKAATESPYGGYTGLSHQSYLPVHAKRSLSPNEDLMLNTVIQNVI